VLQKYTLTHSLRIPLQMESLTTAICYKVTSFYFRDWSIWNTALRGQTVSTNISVNNLHALIWFQISQLHLPCITPVRSTAHIPYIYFPATSYTSAPTKQSFPTAASQSPCTLSHPVNIPIFTQQRFSAVSTGLLLLYGRTGDPALLFIQLREVLLIDVVRKY